MFDVLYIEGILASNLYEEFDVLNVEFDLPNVEFGVPNVQSSLTSKTLRRIE